LSKPLYSKASGTSPDFGAGKTEVFSGKSKKKKNIASVRMQSLKYFLNFPEKTSVFPAPKSGLVP
jgi:hypothetical protein